MNNIEAYVEYMKSEQKSACTIKSYRQDIEQMMNIINKSENEIEFVDFTMWKNAIGNCAPKSINRKISAVKNYFGWLYDMKIINENPTSNIKRVKEYEVNKHEYIPMEDAKRLIQYGKNERDRAIIATFLSTGIRANELVNLTLDDYIGRDNCNILAKGKVARHITWTEDCKKYINEYLLTRKECGINNLFVSNQGTKMNEVSMLKTIKVIAKRAGFDENVCLHSMRHSCISFMCNEYGISAAQHYVNHSDIAITQKYAHNTEKEIENMAMSISL